MWKYPSQYQYFWTDFCVCVYSEKTMLFLCKQVFFTHWNFSTKCEYLLNKHQNPAFPPPLRSTAPIPGREGITGVLVTPIAALIDSTAASIWQKYIMSATVWAECHRKDSMGQTHIKVKSIGKCQHTSILQCR